jgi:hypothetical protein
LHIHEDEIEALLRREVDRDAPILREHDFGALRRRCSVMSADCSPVFRQQIRPTSVMTGSFGTLLVVVASIRRSAEQIASATGPASSVTEKVLPLSGCEGAAIVPPNSLESRWLIVSPRPDPPKRLVVESSAWLKG